MSKIGLHDPFGYLKHKLCPKERLGVKSTIWLSTTKSRESPWFPCVQVACHIPLEIRNKGYNFAWDLTSIGGLHIKLWDSKVKGIPILGILRLPFGSPKAKWHLGVGLVARHKKYYKREDGGFPQVWIMVSLMSLCLFVARPCTKSIPTMH
jgi:hypothetical protein